MKIEKVERLVANSYDETEYVIHIRNLKKALNNGLVLEKVYRVIKSNQNAWLKPHIDMNTDLKNIIFKKHFFKLINNAILGKSMKNVRKHRDIELVTTESRKNYLVSEQNFHISKFFTEMLLAIEIKNRDTYEWTCLFKTFNSEIKSNINVGVLLWICKMKIWWKSDAESFTVYIKTDDIYKGISEDLKADLILEIKN